MCSPWQYLLRVFAISLAPLLASCSEPGEPVLATAVISSDADLSPAGLRLSPVAQHVRAARASGLVARDPNGDIVPALAESWLVTDDGLSYIFRLREISLPDGRSVDADMVRQSLERSRLALRATSLGLDLSPIEDIRAMTGRVLELRLATPEPDFLMLLAQPELAIRVQERWLGDMMLVRDRPADRGSDQIPDQAQDQTPVRTLDRTQNRTQVSDTRPLLLRLRPPAERGQPESEDWAQFAQDIAITPLAGPQAIARFYEGDYDLVLGGGVAHMPLVNTGPLTRGTARIDPAIGLFGLFARNAEGVLAMDTTREAVAMAIDRQALLARFAASEWFATTRLVSPGLPGDGGLIGERWLGETIEERRARARARLEAIEDKSLVLALGDGPGYDIIYEALSEQLALVGISLERTMDARMADLVMLDRTARYADARWFLNQFHCSLRRGLCNAQVDELVADALAQRDTTQRTIMMAQAEAVLTIDNIFIPLARPLRWSLVRGDVEPFAPNSWAFHPLPPLALVPR